jgi:hypothetical protein
MSENQSQLSKESSLTAPEDRTSTILNPWRPSKAKPLTDEETDAAMEEINVNKYISFKFPREDRVYADPALVNQTYSLFSFIPAKGAKPNEKGVFGYAKIRGCFGTDIETNQRAEYLIRNVDSYHPIYHAFVGRPFPVTSNSKYSAEVNEIDIKKEMTESISSDVKAKKAQEKKTIEEIKEREQALLAENKKILNGEDTEDDFENYITLKVKKAQLTWTYVEHKKKMEEIQTILAKTKKNIEELEVGDSSFKDKYFDKYKKARTDAGIIDSESDLNDNFMKYMVEDLEIPEVDEVYNKLFKTETSAPTADTETA